MRKTILILAAASAVTAIPASAQAPHQAVSLAGLDLSTPAGRARFERRIAGALETVCGSYAGAAAYEIPEIDRCRAEARSGIETRIAALRSRGAPIRLGSR